jgi:hypothetical protein
MYLFAVRTTWIGALVVVAAFFVLWLLFRALIDFVHWFHEEIIEDFLERRRKKKAKKNDRRSNGEP